MSISFKALTVWSDIVLFATPMTGWKTVSIHGSTDRTCHSGVRTLWSTPNVFLVPFVVYLRRISAFQSVPVQITPLRCVMRAQVSSAAMVLLCWIKISKFWKQRHLHFWRWEVVIVRECHGENPWAYAFKADFLFCFCFRCVNRHFTRSRPFYRAYWPRSQANVFLVCHLPPLQSTSSLHNFRVPARAMQFQASVLSAVCLWSSWKLW